MKMFVLNQLTKQIEINEPEVLLIKEFAALSKRDKTKLKTRMMRELTYIYLAIDWSSPYRDYSEQERHEEALSDAALSQEEFDVPIFRAACRKYQALQDSNKSIKLLSAAKTAADKLIEYFEDIVDLNERTDTGTTIFKAKDVIAEMQNINKCHQTLKELEEIVKQDLQEGSTIRAGQVDGFHPYNI